MTQHVQVTDKENKENTRKEKTHKKATQATNMREVNIDRRWPSDTQCYPMGGRIALGAAVMGINLLEKASREWTCYLANLDAHTNSFAN